MDSEFLLCEQGVHFVDVYSKAMSLEELSIFCWGWKPQFPECNTLGGDSLMHVEALQWPNLRAICHYELGDEQHLVRGPADRTHWPAAHCSRCGWALRPAWSQTNISERETTQTAQGRSSQFVGPPCAADRLLSPLGRISRGGLQEVSVRVGFSPAVGRVCRCSSSSCGISAVLLAAGFFVNRQCTEE